jgi:ABC-type glycerol-3-phosphate transport system permease component
VLVRESRRGSRMDGTSGHPPAGQMGSFSSRQLRPVRGRGRRGPLRIVRRTAVYVPLLFGCAISVAPLYYVIRTSLESYQTYVTGVGGLSLSSWRAALHSTGVLAETVHSAIVTLSAIAAILLLSTLAGYGFAKLRPRGASFAFIAIVAGFMIPVQSIIVPLYLDSAHFQLIGSYFGAIVVYTGLGLPFSVFLMTSFFRGIPDDLIEASLIDGLGYTELVFRVLLRLCVPAFVAVGILQFISIWNDLLIAMLWLPDPAERTITVGLATIGSAHTFPIPEILAAAIIQAVPAVVLFSVFQRYLIRGLTLGVSR